MMHRLSFAPFYHGFLNIHSFFTVSFLFLHQLFKLYSEFCGKIEPSG